MKKKNNEKIIIYLFFDFLNTYYFNYYSNSCFDYILVINIHIHMYSLINEVVFFCFCFCNMCLNLIINN